MDVGVDETGYTVIGVRSFPYSGHGAAVYRAYRATFPLCTTVGRSEPQPTFYSGPSRPEPRTVTGVGNRLKGHPLGNKRHNVTSRRNPNFLPSHCRHTSVTLSLTPDRTLWRLVTDREAAVTDAVTDKIEEMRQL